MKPTITLLILLSLIGNVTVHANTQELMGTPVTTIDGRIVKLGDIVSHTKPVYLKFWATWCQPCMQQMPHLQHTFEKYGQSLDIVAVNLGINDSDAAINQVREKFNLTLPVVIDNTQKLSNDFNVIATPYHILIDRNANIVHKGHDANDALNSTIERLAKNNNADLPTVALEKSSKTYSLNTNTEVTTLLFFTSAWCDWYLEKRRSEMASACVNAQKAVNTAYERYSKLNWTGILTRLWTSEKELNEYKDKYGIKHRLLVDESNELFMKYKVHEFPTLIAIKNGKEIFRLKEFNNPQSIDKTFEKFNLKN